MKRAGFIFLVTMTLVFAMAARTPVDSDLWWHLRAGETTVLTGQPLLEDQFSFTRYGTSWINHSWLSQVLMFLVFRWGGYAGLAALVALTACASMGLIYVQMEAPAILRAFVLVFITPVIALVWSARPQVFSLLLFSLVSYLLYLYKWKKTDRLIWLIPVFILWSNLHGGYVLGILMIGAMIAGEIFNQLMGYSGAEVLSWQRIARLLGWALAAGLAVLINPNGMEMWSIPFRTVGVGVLRDFIPEWASPNFHELAQQPFIWLLLATFAAIGASGKRLDGSDMIGFAAFAYLGLLARRNFGPFALSAGPVLIRHLWPALRAWWLRLPGVIVRQGDGGVETQTETSLFQWLTIRLAGSTGGRQVIASGVSYRVLDIAILSLLVGAALLKLWLVSNSSFVEQHLERLYPAAAVRWIESHRPAGPMFNSYNWGGYLLWQLRPYPVFVDGRTDLYDETLLCLYLEIHNGAPGWQAALDEYQVNLILVEADCRLAIELALSQDWRLAYADSQAVVYQRR
jgi:hypothetical protein